MLQWARIDGDVLHIRLMHAELKITIPLNPAIHCAMVSVVVLPRIPHASPHDPLPSIYQNCDLHFRIIFTKEKGT